MKQFVIFGMGNLEKAATSCTIWVSEVLAVDKDQEGYKIYPTRSPTPFRLMQQMKTP